jgi:hypothetical protein
MHPTHFADSNACSAPKTLLSKYLSSNFVCLKSSSTILRTLNACTLVTSEDFLLPISASDKSALMALSSRVMSVETKDRTEYGRAADRRVVKCWSEEMACSSC